MDVETVRTGLLATRRAKKLSRRELAQRTRVSPSAIQNAEKGPDTPGLDIVLRLIDGLGLTPGQFFTAIEDTTAQKRTRVHTLVLPFPGVGLTTPLADVANRVTPEDPYGAYSAVLDRLHALANVLYHVTENIQSLNRTTSDRAAGFAVADPSQQITAARVIAPRSPVADRKSRRRHAGKDRKR